MTRHGFLQTFLCCTIWIPTGIPTWVPSSQPTEIPTWVPTTNQRKYHGCADLRAYLGTYESTHGSPTVPSSEPTWIPTMQPSSVPTWIPTNQPTEVPFTSVIRAHLGSNNRRKCRQMCLQVNLLGYLQINPQKLT